jgi:hypothetical protein
MMVDTSARLAIPKKSSAGQPAQANADSATDAKCSLAKITALLAVAVCRLCRKVGEKQFPKQPVFAPKRIPTHGALLCLEIPLHVTS